MNLGDRSGAVESKPGIHIRWPLATSPLITTSLSFLPCTGLFSPLLNWQLSIFKQVSLVLANRTHAKYGESNVFSRICHSVHEGGGCIHLVIQMDATPLHWGACTPTSRTMHPLSAVHGYLCKNILRPYSLLSVPSLSVYQSVRVRLHASLVDNVRSGQLRLK